MKTIHKFAIAIALVNVMALTTPSYAEEYMPSVSRLLETMEENIVLDKKRIAEYHIAINDRKVRSSKLLLSRVKWFNHRNTCFTRSTGSLNIVCLNKALKDRVAAIQAMK
jgi:hypothetical protein